MPVSSVTEHWIKQDAIIINLNHFGDPDYLQVSVLAGAVVMAFKQDVIGYNAARNYRTWPLQAANTFLETTDALNVYARLTRSEVNASALIIYDPLLRDIEGRSILYADDGSEVLGEADEEYYYIYLGQISSSLDSNGNEIGREWSVDFRFGNLDTNQYRNEDGGGEWTKMFRLNKVTDMIDVLKTFSSAIFKKIFIGNKGVTDIKRSSDTDKDVPVSDESLTTSKYVKESTEKKFLRKDQPDQTSFLIKFLNGIEVGDTTGDKGAIIDEIGRIIAENLRLRSDFTIGKEGYAEGMTGFGGKIDENANAELESLRLRRFLEVPELRFNRIEVKLGDKWNAPGAGIIERVEPDVNADGTLAMSGTAWLKLEEGEYGAIAVGDICMGIFHSLDSSMNATEDYDSADGIFQYAGFYTCYFTITDITGADNKEFRYQMRPTSEAWRLSYHPSAAMTFVSYGSFTDPNRMSSQYTTRTYTRLLVWQNSWEIKASNIAMQWGDLSNLAIHGINMQGYSAYLNNIYMTGVIKQFNSAGHEIKVANDRGEYVSGTHYDYYDRVSYDGGLWLCVAEGGTNTVPSKNDSAWLNQVPAAQGITSQPSWDSSKVPYPASTILKFADRVWISNKETSAAPLPLYTDPNGNYYKTPEGGYYIASETQSADWELLLDASGLVEGEDGASIEVRYSADGTNWHFPYKDGDIYMQQRIGSDSAWSDIINFVGADGKNGSDGQYAEYQFAVNDSLTIAPTTGWQDTPPTVGDGQYLWMRMRIVDPNTNTATSWSVARIGGEEGTSVFKSTVFIRTNNTPSTPEGGSYASPKPTTTGWSDGIPEGEQILWASTRVFTHNGKKPQEDVWSTPRQMTDTADFDVEFSSVENPNPPTGHPNTNTQWSNESGTDTIWMATSQKKNGVWGEWKVSKIKGEKGDMGVSITTHGQWKNGKVVPVMGIVTMAGNSYIAKIETSNPPLWCYTDPNGNYYLTPEGGYYLTGEENTEEYDLLTTSGKDGSDGKDYEWIYQVKATDDVPSTPNSVQQDDYVPSGWNDNPTGVSETIPYEFASFRTKKDGVWSAFSTPALWAKFGKDGIQGLQGIQGERGEQGIQGEKGDNGQTSYFHIKYADDAIGTNMNESGGDYIGTYVDFVEADSTDPKKYTWVKTKGAQGERGEQGIQGENGENGETSYLHIAYANSADGKDGFSVSDSKGKLYIGQYTDFILEDSTDYTKYKWTLIKGEQGIQGEKGDGFTMMGNWRSGLLVPIRGIVMMGGSTFAAKRETTNPPLYCYLTPDNNYYLTPEGGYYLTGESNTDDYELWAEKGADGKDGKDGAQGEKGEQGEQGIQGEKGDKGDTGAIGYSGCVTRTWDSYIPTQIYRNDSEAAPNELEVSGIRYLDILLVESETSQSGYEAFECVRTCVGSDPRNQEYKDNISADGNWRIGTNLASAFIAKFIALDANIKFASSGQLTILDENNVVCAGMAGSQEGDKTRIWAGGNNPDNAPFRVNQEGAGQLADGRMVWGEDGSLQFVNFADVENEYIKRTTTITEDGISINYFNPDSSERFITASISNKGLFINDAYTGGVSVAHNSITFTNPDGSKATIVGRDSIDTWRYYCQGKEGVSGEFTSADGKMITVTGGIITKIE